MEEFDNKIILNDEAGNEVEFEFLDLIEYQGEEFVVLLPCDEADEAGEVVILKLEDTDDEENESYASVDDESVLNAVFDIFKDKSLSKIIEPSFADIKFSSFRSFTFLLL